MNSKRKSIVLVLAVVVVLVIAGMVWMLSKNNMSPGEQLARQHCASCHVFPEPELLPKSLWSESVMPQMAFRMGFPNFEIEGRIPPADLRTVLETIPGKPLITPEQFKAIRDYYIEHAPAQLRIPESEYEELSQFKPEPVPFEKPFLTLLEVDTASQKLYIGTQNAWFYTIDQHLKTVDSLQVDSPPSYISHEGDSLIISLVGILMPNDQSRGKLVTIAGTPLQSRTLLDSLRRPVHFIHEDMDDDGQKDFVVSSFGHHVGGLSWFKGEKSGLSQHALSNTPGARKVIVKDFNGDKRKDILALFAQGDERLVLYLNQGTGSFTEKTVLRLPPVYGSNYFELADFNKDGFDDILLTNGDNGDFTIIQKPYHGVRIFLNNGKNEFSDFRFIPMPGASQAVARDFDQDGDLDIAAISFFPDFERHPERTFIYLKNDGNNEFTPQFTKAGSLGRWLLMNTWDYDHDGDLDIFLGASSYRGLGANEALFRQWSANATPLLLLKNELIKK